MDKTLFSNPESFNLWVCNWIQIVLEESELLLLEKQWEIKNIIIIMCESVKKM